MKTLKSFWNDSPPEYKDYLFIYLWGVLWPATYLFITPPSTLYILNVTLVAFWTLTAATGGVIAFLGLIKRDNLLMERLGVSMLMVGPISFATTQLGQIIYKSIMDDPVLGPPWSHIHVLVFAVWPLLFLNKRRRQLKTRVDVAKKVPLRSEGGTE